MPAFEHVKQIAENFHELIDHPCIELTTLHKSINHLQAIERGPKTCGIDTAKMSPLIAFIIV